MSETTAHDETHAFVLKYGNRKFKMPYLHLMPEYTKEEDKALEASLKDKGVLEPVTVTSDDTVLSGHNRLIKAQKLGIPLREINVVVRDMSKEEEEAFVENVIAVNFVGRRPTPERRKHMAHMLAQRHFSSRRIALMLGCHHTTIADDLNEPDPLALVNPEAGANGTAEPPALPDKIVGADGQTYSRKKVKQTTVTEKDEGTASPSKAKKAYEQRKKYRQVAMESVKTLQRALDRLGIGEEYAEITEAVVERLRGLDLKARPEPAGAA